MSVKIFIAYIVPLRKGNVKDKEIFPIRKVFLKSYEKFII